MKTHYPLCALRRERRSWGFSQRELAELLGFNERSSLSRIEHGKRTPGLEIALACATLFGVSLGELFPQLALEVGERLRDRIAKLRKGLVQTTNRSALRKQELLEFALRRANDEPLMPLV